MVQECARRSENLGLHSPTAYSEHSLRALLEGHDPLRELSPALSGPDATFQGWEDIDHSLRHGSEIGLAKTERCQVDIQIHEQALWQKAQPLESRVLQDVLEIIDDIRSVEVDLQLPQLVAMN